MVITDGAARFDGIRNKTLIDELQLCDVICFGQSLICGILIA
jgi:hypothetical protein